jgi:hypothetical protein
MNKTHPIFELTTYQKHYGTQDYTFFHAQLNLLLEAFDHEGYLQIFFQRQPMLLKASP